VPPLASWYVFTYATDTLYTYVCPVLGCTDSSATNFNPSAAIDDSSCLFGPAQCGGLSTVTFDDHTYALVGIGTQCWFAENLRSDNYRNGDSIGSLPSNNSSSRCNAFYAGEGLNAIYGGAVHYCSPPCGNAINPCIQDISLTAFGRLYNGHAVADSRGLCPLEWHVSTDIDWMELEEFLGMDASELQLFGTRGNIADQLKSNMHWCNLDGIANQSGFSALPSGGLFDDCGASIGALEVGNWWSFSGVNSSISRSLRFDSIGVARSQGYPEKQNLFFAVRCVRD
jgi:uncharacterized protein (TIGR02145 family)